MTSRRRSDICLVNMPKASIVRPSLALGLLKSILQRHELPTTVVYPNLWYVEFMQPHRSMIPSRPEECLVDWLFSGVAFPTHELSAEPFFESLFRGHPTWLAAPFGDPHDLLWELRARIPEFVDLAAGRILETQPRIVGCTSTFEQHVPSLAVLRRIRELAPDVVTMLGGANCETVMGMTTHEHCEWVDIVVSGEADSIIAPLCRQLLEHGPDLPRDRLPAGAFAPIHRREGYPRIEGGDGLPRGTTPSLAGLPPPDYDDYFFGDLPEFRYRDRVRPGIPYESSRGCWWGERSHCTFCGLNGGGMGFRSKSPEQVIREIEGLADRYGSHRLQAVDNIIDMTYFESVLPHFTETELGLSLFYETKANLKRSQIEAFHRAGVNFIQPGIESLHTEVLRLIGKGLKSYQNVQTLKWCRQFGVRAAWNMIVGFPGERDEWYRDMATWLPLLEHLEPGAPVPLRYDRYSPYFVRANEYGLELRPCQAYESVYPLPPEQLRDQVYFFTDEKTRLSARIQAGERPGASAVFDQLASWREAEGRARLEWDHTRDGDVVLDTRTCATATHHVLSRSHRLVLEACDSAVPPSRIHEAIAREGSADGSAIDDVVQDLRERKLVVELDGRLLALVLDRPEPHPPAEEAPGGSFVWDEYRPDAEIDPPADESRVEGARETSALQSIQ